ncbi:hypothetical protein [Pseudomonas sp. St316]|uniref:hypothetical protein n=1 Tax=Pseudomonas sp. St316 TaxID=2678257 RepID=UPI001BB33E96|nr:hypothetical protein [Pseudomonas sp. St316]BBP60391.1 hypothetical protein PHLH4_39810 [Pseudomonas sp. St316]
MSNSVFEASDEVVNEAAAACARRLAKWFGGIEEAIAALEADPIDLADLALRDHVKERRQMTIKAHMNIQVFSRDVLEQVA